MAEHHIPGPTINRIESFLRTVGRRALTSLATPPGNSDNGTHGGVLLAPYTHLSLLPIASAGQYQLFHRGLDFVACIVRLRGVDILVIQLDLEIAVGLKKEQP